MTTDPVTAFLQANALAPAAFEPGSRYYGIPTAQLRQPDGRTVVYVRRRFLPPPEEFAVLQTVRVVAGDRLDNLAARHIGDPQLWWRLCDANGAMSPEALVAEPGATLDLTLPQGVPAPTGGDHG
ncbi:LysM domain-containing protein [Xylophilus sp. GOD-11R]|uniref:LysM domain-containing protein n=1 Tax=Xylophilus sp. GOD-11R TaxID=3089814 RepID=UPI00298CBE91|nr:LysM domain-containing protein [Xylophilus sp. GOD-11R]WPB55026.1 LysM domain-containing protein [Xylophilus sp. GOD-11R]